MIPLYMHRDSPLHRLGAGPKLAALFGLSVVVVALPALWAQAALFAGALALYPLARLPLAAILRSLRPVLLMIALIALAQLTLSGPERAALMALSIATLVLLATLVSLTTPLSAMIAALSALARPLRRFRLDPNRFALAIALAIRFIPVLMKEFAELKAAREARMARGPVVLAAGPLLIRALKMADTLAQAIEARGFDNRK